MRALIISLLSSLVLHLLAATVSAGSAAHFWSQRFGGTSSDIGNAVAVDPDGNVFVAGSFGGTVDFGGGPLTASGTDIFLAKYSPTGVHLWSQRFGGTGTDVALAAAVDLLGTVYITGSFNGTMSFGGGSLVSAGATDIFLARFDWNGQHVFSKSFGGGFSDVGLGVATVQASHVVITGYFTDTVNFGGSPLLSTGSTDIFVAKFDQNGNHQWSLRAGDSGPDEGASVAIDGSGNIFATGYFRFTVNFGGGALIAPVAQTMFLVKFNSSGAHQWSQGFGDQAAYGRGVAVDGSGNVATTGRFVGTIDFGGGSLVSAGSSFDVFVAKFAANGAHQWSQGFGANLADAGNGVAMDSSGNVLIAGLFRETVDFGGGPLTATLGDMFIAKYDASGTHVWSGRAGGSSTDEAKSVAVEPSGNALTTGFFYYIADFGGGPLVSAGAEDVFLAMYGANAGEPTIVSIADVGNDQGRRLAIEFTSSGLDAPGASAPVTSYEAYRRNDASPSSPAGLSQRQLLDAGWTQVAAVSAHAHGTYGIEVPTLGDSTDTLGPYYSTYFIRAATETPALYFDSLPDSAYSVDNLSPGAPLNLVFSSGDLDWQDSTAEDFDYFTVYGSQVDDFGTAVVVDYTATSLLDVTSAAYAIYFVTATDFSGNESLPAKVNTLSDIGGSPRSFVLSVSNYPNPFNPRTTVSYTVPFRGPVTIAIYDIRGAHVATLVDDAMHDAGVYRAEWSGRTNAGNAVSSGVYLARIEHEGAYRIKKMVLLK